MKPSYRKGALGALLDEYERVAAELRNVLLNLSEADYARVVDSNTNDENCRSAQTIMAHVISAGYGYAACIRGAFRKEAERPPKRLPAYDQVLPELEAMLAYTSATFEGKWEYSSADIRNTVMRTSWHVTYDLEQMLEHAVVHVMRHRRHIEKLYSEKFARRDDSAEPREVHFIS